MTSHILSVAEDFWNIRGSFRIGGLVDIGTQASLVRRANGKFVLIDSCSLSRRVGKEIDVLTKGGREIEAILHVHPFHTVSACPMYERFPHAKLYGTARHVAQAPELPWESLRTEDPDLHALFADDFEFSIPRGVDFISANENIHVSSVLVFHRASKTIHVDDTFMYLRLPRLMRSVGLPDFLNFHPTLAQALESRPGAAQEFRNWAKELASNWSEAENLCAAHTAALLARDNRGAPISERIALALVKVENTLRCHERKVG